MRISPQDSATCARSLEETPPAPRRKGHFNIGLYAKRRKLAIEQLVDDKIAADIKVKSLQNKLNYQKQKVGYFNIVIF